MTHDSIWRAVLITVLSVALATQALADKPRLAPTNIGPSKKEAAGIVIGIVVVAVAAVVVVVLLVRHKSQQKSITGCVDGDANRMSVTDEKDRRRYALSGETASLKAGNRMTLEGRRRGSGGTLVFEAHKVARDFGPCHP